MFRSIVRLLAIAMCVAAIGCGKTVVGPEPPGPSEPPQSPPPNVYRMEAKLNGKDWKAALPGPGGDTLKAVAAYDPASRVLVMAGWHWPLMPDTTEFSLMLFVAITPLQAGTIPLGGPDTTGGVPRGGGAGFSDAHSQRSWGTDETHRGSLIIDRVDLDRHVVEGRFDYLAVSKDDGSILEVRSGVFVCRLEAGEPALARAAGEGGHGPRPPVVDVPSPLQSIVADKAATLAMAQLAR